MAQLGYWAEYYFYVAVQQTAYSLGAHPYCHKPALRFSRALPVRTNREKTKEIGAEKLSF
jgi:hypothetical protein